MINLFITSKKNQKNPPKNINEPKTKNQPEIIFAFSRTLKVKKKHLI
jgi:hypothetical protein